LIFSINTALFSTLWSSNEKLAKANVNRDYRIYESYAAIIVSKAQKLSIEYLNTNLKGYPAWPDLGRLLNPIVF
jgi:hypothetical protein